MLKMVLKTNMRVFLLYEEKSVFVTEDRKWIAVNGWQLVESQHQHGLKKKMQYYQAKKTVYYSVDIVLPMKKLFIIFIIL